MSNEQQQQEAFTNAEYCYVDEPGHTGGWTCRHPEHAYPKPAKHCEWTDTLEMLSILSSGIGGSSRGSGKA